MKLIFLDIDGVLNSVAWQANRPPKKPPPLIVDALAYWKRSLDPKCIERVNRIWQETGAAVVVSSSWRTILGRGELWVTLIEAGLKADLDGITPDLEGQSRWAEIVTCINSRGKWTEQFVILDDDPMPDAPVGNFVRTDYKVGLTDADADRTIAILKGVTS